VILKYIQTPTVDVVQVLKALALNARTHPADETLIIGPSSLKRQRERQTPLPLESHLAWHGLEADLARHTEFMRLQGWTHFMSDHGPKWVIRRDTPSWITPLYFLPRCLGCARRRWGKCRCDDRGRPGRRAPQAYVYILELETPQHFYVGTTVDPEARMARHAARSASVWTRSHKPVLIRALQSVRPEAALDIENQTTLDLIAKVGCSVRGGVYLTSNRVDGAWRRCFRSDDPGPLVAPSAPSSWRWGHQPSLTPIPRHRPPSPSSRLTPWQNTRTPEGRYV
jgi:predicted GIY-YIG superfamily endonuclease